MIVRFFVCLYTFGIIAYAVVREGSCIRYLQLSKPYAVLEDKLRMVGK